MSEIEDTFDDPSEVVLRHHAGKTGASWATKPDPIRSGDTVKVYSVCPHIALYLKPLKLGASYEFYGECATCGPVHWSSYVTLAMGNWQATGIHIERIAE